jgi:hypothetical protein
METALGTLITLAVPAYLALQGYALLWLRGRWRTAALLPLLATVPSAAVAIKLLAEGSSLWPMPVLIVSPVAALYLLLLIIAHLLSARYAPATRAVAGGTTSAQGVQS